MLDSPLGHVGDKAALKYLFEPATKGGNREIAECRHFIDRDRAVLVGSNVLDHGIQTSTAAIIHGVGAKIDTGEPAALIDATSEGGEQFEDADYASSRLESLKRFDLRD